MNGEFDNAPEYTPYSVIATFDVGEDNYQFKYDDEGNPVFHRGYDFDAIITIGARRPVNSSNKVSRKEGASLTDAPSFWQKTIL